MEASQDKEHKSAIGLDLLLDDFVLDKTSNYLKELFEFPSGKWAEAKHFLEQDYYASN